jgi:hypothetical protein
MNFETQQKKNKIVEKLQLKMKEYSKKEPEKSELLFKSYESTRDFVNKQKEFDSLVDPVEVFSAKAIEIIWGSSSDGVGKIDFVPETPDHLDSINTQYKIDGPFLSTLKRDINEYDTNMK